MIPELLKMTYAERLDELNLWTLEERRVRADLIEVYKITHGLSAVKFESSFEFDSNKRTRGHSCKLTKKRFRTVNTSLLKELLMCGTVLMNKLLVLAVSSVSKAIFSDSGVT